MWFFMSARHSVAQGEAGKQGQGRRLLAFLYLRTALCAH
jgi:hypothetical protein